MDLQLPAFRSVEEEKEDEKKGNKKEGRNEINRERVEGRIERGKKTRKSFLKKHLLYFWHHCAE